MFLSHIRKENFSNPTCISPSVLGCQKTAFILQSYPLIISFHQHDNLKSRHVFLIIPSPLPHLNYTTPPPKIVEQIVNILPPTSSLYLSQSQNPRPILPQIMQQPSAQITIFFQPRPAKSKLVKLRLCLLLFISPSPHLSFTPKSVPKLFKN